MDKLSEEMITAWLDGEVTQQQHSEIEAAIAASPELGVRIAQLARADRLLAPAFAETLNAPIPKRFEAVIGGARQHDSLSSFRRALSGLLSPRPMAMAAASLIVGVMLGGVILSGTPDDPGIATDSQGRMIASNAMASGLASVVSGAKTGQLDIRLSFVDSGGRYCRQFETPAAAGLACLEGEAWVIDTLSGAGATPNVGGAYVMAGDSTDIVITAAIERLGVQRVLDSREEAAAMASGWTTSKD